MDSNQFYFLAQGNKEKEMPETAKTIESIRQLGESSPPTEAKNDIHILPIIGQIEGHMVLPPKK